MSLPATTPVAENRATAPTEPILLTVEQAAKILNIGRDRVWAIVHSGHLPSIKFSPRVIRISKRALERWVEEQGTGASAIG